MGDALSKLFVPLHSLPGLYSLPADCLSVSDSQLHPTFGGLFQLFFLFLCYAAILFNASNMIADGSELLLLLPEIAPIVGSVVIPILGAVPDGAVVLFSGLGEREKAQEQLSVGVGALAGSTIMLLTIPWFLSVLAGRVSITSSNTSSEREIGQFSDSRESKGERRCQYSRPYGVGKEGWKKLQEGSELWNGTGVEPDFQAVSSGAKVMLVTAISYVLIQGAASVFEAEKVPDKDLPKDEEDFALVGLIFCTLFFFWYLITQVRNSGSDSVLQDYIDRKREAAVKSGMLSLQGAFFNALGEFDAEDHSGAQLLEKGSKKQRFEAVVRKFFSQYDVNNDNSIDRHELKLLLTDLHIPHDEESIGRFMEEMDSDGNGIIHFGEFLDSMIHFLSSTSLAGSQRQLLQQRQQQAGQQGEYGSIGTQPDRIEQLMHHHEQSRGQLQSRIEQQQNDLQDALRTDDAERGHGAAHGERGGEGDEEEEEEEEDVPEDLADLPPQVQRRRILLRSLRLMLSGTALVLLFSDPMVDVMSEIGNVLGVKPFYISFVLAPLASNASELIASYNYALKKTSKTITISLTSLTGAAIMNNTFCLGIFLALVYFRKLAWKFSAETISILFVEFGVAYIAFHKIQTVKLAAIVLTLFPLSILLVYVLENVFGLD